MKQLSLLIILMFVGCTARQPIDRNDITLEECKQARERYYQACLRFEQSNDINEKLYIFNDSRPVVGLKSGSMGEAYRLLLLRSFYSPVLITVFVNNDKAELNLRASKNSGCFLPILIKNKTIQLTRQQLQVLRKAIHENQFWEGKLSDARGYDGADWIIEIKQQGVYHFGKEWSPERGAILNIGRCLLEMSQYDLKDDPLL